MFQFKEEIDCRGHSWFDRKLIENKNWALLPLCSKGIYPVIAIHRNKEGIAFPGEQVISILSGMSDKTVRKGIKGLSDFPGLKTINYVTKRGRRSKKFTIATPPNEPGRAFPFYKSVFTGGNWLHLIPSAQALYPVMRHFAYFDAEIFEMYQVLEDEDYDLVDFDECYRERKWDFCLAELGVLAEYAGITVRSVENALPCLEKNELIKSYTSRDFRGWRVYLKPRLTYKAGYLNQLILKKYRHLIEV